MTTNTQIAERRKTQAKNLPAAAKKCISSGFGFTIFAPLPVHISGIDKVFTLHGFGVGPLELFWTFSPTESLWPTNPAVLFWMETSLRIDI